MAGAQLAQVHISDVWMTLPRHNSSCKAELVNDGVDLLDVVEVASDQLAQVHIFNIRHANRCEASGCPREAGATAEQDAQDPVLLGVPVDQSPGHDPPGGRIALWNHILRRAEEDRMLDDSWSSKLTTSTFVMYYKVHSRIALLHDT